MTDICVRISKAACRYAREGTLAETELGATMHIALGHGPQAGTRRNVRAPVPAWLAFLDWLRSETSTVPGEGHEAEKRSAVLIRARRAIAVELDRLAKHPAYRGVGVRGTASTILPAYRMGEGRWWPTPDMAAAAADGTTLEMEVADLVPTWRKVTGQEFTEWTPIPPGS